MSAEYISLVLEDYKKKKEHGILSYNLMALTTAKINRECLIVFDKRYERRDERLLKSFFNEREEYAELRQAIKRCEPDRFRALIKFLKGQSKTTDEKNIELLAWLIDFADRPYKPDYQKMYETSEQSIPENNILNEEEVTYEIGKESSLIQPLLQTKPKDNVKEDDNNLSLIANSTNNTKSISSEKTSTSKSATRIAIYISIAAIAFAGIVVFVKTTYKKNTHVQTLLPATSMAKTCMFWTKDHYEQINCNQHPQNVKVFPFDVQKWSSLKKITMPDTITLKALGHVWYVKVNNNLEYYTSDGFHPIHTDLRLKPLTEYIYNKYLRR